MPPTDLGLHSRPAQQSGAASRCAIPCCTSTATIAAAAQRRGCRCCNCTQPALAAALPHNRRLRPDLSATTAGEALAGRGHRGGGRADRRLGGGGSVRDLDVEATASLHLVGVGGEPELAAGARGMCY